MKVVLPAILFATMAVLVTFTIIRDQTRNATPDPDGHPQPMNSPPMGESPRSLPAGAICEAQRDEEQKATVLFHSIGQAFSTAAPTVQQAVDVISTLAGCAHLGESVLKDGKTTTPISFIGESITGSAVESESLTMICIRDVQVPGVARDEKQLSIHFRRGDGDCLSGCQLQLETHPSVLPVKTEKSAAALRSKYDGASAGWSLTWNDKKEVSQVTSKYAVVELPTSEWAVSVTSSAKDRKTVKQVVDTEAFRKWLDLLNAHKQPTSAQEH